MKIRVFATLLAVGVVLLAGCSRADRGPAAPSAATTAPFGIIRSQSDLQRYLSATARSGSPLNALSSRGRTRFISSITFNRRGLTGFRYDDLQVELTASQIFDVLHLFGAEKDLAIIPNVRVETAADRRLMSSIAPRAPARKPTAPN